MSFAGYQNFEGCKEKSIEQGWKYFAFQDEKCYVGDSFDEYGDQPGNC